MSDRKQPRLRAALAARLRALRKAKKLSQERLGFASRMSGKFIGEVERGEKSISLDSLARLARALGVPLHELVNLEERAIKSFLGSCLNGSRIASSTAMPCSSCR